jgi:hypothetical protein
MGTQVKRDRNIHETFLGGQKRFPYDFMK